MMTVNEIFQDIQMDITGQAIVLEAPNHVELTIQGLSTEDYAEVFRTNANGIVINGGILIGPTAT